MHNDFYTDFDLERFPETTTQEGDYRTAFQIERDRIIFSYPFRRLQSKTQVFQSGEYDFYRTRLTHSIEVAKVGRSICEFLLTNSDLLKESFHIDADLTEAICLAHDLGHPPFGHIGERKLNDLMAKHGGFEGNGQTLRILTELIYERPGRTKGIAPTRAFLDGVMKYKATQGDWLNQTGKAPENHFIYDEQAQWRDQIFDGVTIPADLLEAKALNKFKSIECQIMDWADDTAYSLHMTCANTGTSPSILSALRPCLVPHNLPNLPRRIATRALPDAPCPYSYYHRSMRIHTSERWGRDRLRCLRLTQGAARALREISCFT